jgi:glycosyltransferase involved in cell wall biosynthesis
VKGLAALIDAATQLPTAQVVIAGEGPERGRLEQQATELGVRDRVTFLGLRTDVPRLLASSDVLAMPSLNEGLGNAVLEAMAAARPVVASAVGGLSESVVSGETGILVPPGDVEALARALNVVLSDDRLARDMGAAGRRRVEAAFTADQAVEGTTAIWSELLASERRS